MFLLVLSRLARLVIVRIRGVQAVKGRVFLKWARGVGLRSSSETLLLQESHPPPPTQPRGHATLSSLQSELCLHTLKLQKEL